MTVQNASGKEIQRGRAHVLAATHAYLTKLLATNHQMVAQNKRLEFEVSALRKQLSRTSGVSTPAPMSMSNNTSHHNIVSATGEVGQSQMDVDSQVESRTTGDESDMGQRMASGSVSQQEDRNVQMLRRLECSMSEITFEIDRSFNICYVSPGIRYFTGEMPRLLVGKNFQNTIHHEDVRRIKPKFRALLQQG